MTAGTYFDIVYENNTTEMPRLKNFSAPYLAIFEQGGSADVFSLITGGRDDTSKSVIVTLSNLWEGATAPPAPR